MRSSSDELYFCSAFPSDRSVSNIFQVDSPEFITKKMNMEFHN